MALVRWAPSRDLYSVQSELNRLFNSFFDTATPVAGNGGTTTRRWVPALDIVENETDYTLRADLPGLGEDDVKIEVNDNVLTISGRRRDEHEEQQQGYYRLERSYGSFSRSLTLPKGVDAKAVTAAFDRGVLEIHVPKPEDSKPQTVAIKTGPAVELDA
jgi:HSP20 family protein